MYIARRAPPPPLSVGLCRSSPPRGAWMQAACSSDGCLERAAAAWDMALAERRALAPLGLAGDPEVELPGRSWSPNVATLRPRDPQSGDTQTPRGGARCPLPRTPAVTLIPAHQIAAQKTADLTLQIAETKARIRRVQRGASADRELGSGRGSRARSRLRRRRRVSRGLWGCRALR